MKIRTTVEVDTDTGVATIVQSAPRSSDVAPADDAQFGRDQFGTPYESAADRARGEALRGYDADEAKNYTGTIDPDTLQDYDWAFYVNTGLWKSGAKDYAIFTKKPIVRHNDGSTANNPEAEYAGVDVTAYNGPLARFA